MFFLRVRWTEIFNDDRKNPALANAKSGRAHNYKKWNSVHIVMWAWNISFEIFQFVLFFFKYFKAKKTEIKHEKNMNFYFVLFEDKYVI